MIDLLWVRNAWTVVENVNDTIGVLVWFGTHVDESHVGNRVHVSARSHVDYRLHVEELHIDDARHVEGRHVDSRHVDSRAHIAGLTRVWPHVDGPIRAHSNIDLCAYTPEVDTDTSTSAVLFVSAEDGLRHIVTA